MVCRRRATNGKWTERQVSIVNKRQFKEAFVPCLFLPSSMTSLPIDSLSWWEIRPLAPKPQGGFVNTSTCALEYSRRSNATWSETRCSASKESQPGEAQGRSQPKGTTKTCFLSLKSLRSKVIPHTPHWARCSHGTGLNPVSSWLFNPLHLPTASEVWMLKCFGGSWIIDSWIIHPANRLLTGLNYSCCLWNVDKLLRRNGLEDVGETSRGHDPPPRVPRASPPAASCSLWASLFLFCLPALEHFPASFICLNVNTVFLVSGLFI